MTTGDVCLVLDRLAAAGVLNLTLTGGEIFLRKDFPQIYEHALACGFLVNLYTNATRITEKRALFLRSNPPRRIEVSMYGQSENVYEQVVGVKGMFSHFQSGIQHLLDQNLPVYIKMLVTKENEHEFPAIREWAERHTSGFRYDVIISPRLDGNKRPLNRRIMPEHVVNLQLNEPGGYESFIELGEIRESPVERGRTLMCGAGTRTFCVDPYGQLHPCMLWRWHPYDLLHKSIDEKWQAHLSSIKTLPCDPDAVCYTCSDWWSCANKCPAMAILENGGGGLPSPYHCEVCRIRNRQMMDLQKEQ